MEQIQETHFFPDGTPKGTGENPYIAGWPELAGNPAAICYEDASFLVLNKPAGPLRDHGGLPARLRRVLPGGIRLQEHDGLSARRSPHGGLRDV